MITRIGIENFRAFGERVGIPLRPVTLFFGANSAGKSTILNVLNLLKQSMDHGGKGQVLIPRVHGGIVDMGRYRDFVYDHKTENNIAIDIGLSGSDLFPMGRKRLTLSKEVSIEFEFTRSPRSGETGIAAITFKYWGEPLARFEPIDISRRNLRRFRVSSKVIRSSETQKFFCVDIFNNRDFWYDVFEQSDYGSTPARNRALSHAKHIRDILSGDYKIVDSNISKSKKSDAREKFEEYLRYRELSHLLESHLLEYESNGDSSDQRQTLIAMVKASQSFYEEPSPERLFQLASHFAGHIGISVQGFIPQEIMIDRALDVVMNTRSTSFDLVGSLYLLLADIAQGVERELKSLVPLGPFRSAPERFYVFSGTKPVNVGREGESLSDLIFKDKKVLKQTNKWLHKLDVGYELIVKTLGESHSDLYEIALRDTRRTPPVEVNLRDVGFGVSQILPFVVQAVSASNQIISIEQPEVHIHPKLQADLGDLLAEVANSDRQVQMLIETHSEHLVLRLQKLIRQGKINNDDVAIINITKGPTGSTAQRMYLNESGEFLQEWPGGFFTERLNELF